MPTLHAINKLEKLPDFIARHCPEATTTQQKNLCKILAKVRCLPMSAWRLPMIWNNNSGVTRPGERVQCHGLRQKKPAF